MLNYSELQMNVARSCALLSVPPAVAGGLSVKQIPTRYRRWYRPAGYIQLQLVIIQLLMKFGADELKFSPAPKVYCPSLRPESLYVLVRVDKAADERPAIIVLIQDLYPGLERCVRVTP